MFEKEYRLDLIPPESLLAVGAVLHQGVSKFNGKEVWKTHSRAFHVNRALVHIYKYLQGDQDEYHLVNATCRLLYALAQQDEKET